MFKKIVSNLPFSPALVGQLGFYAKRLRKEDATRRLALIFVVLTLVVQSLVIFQPTESANASSQNDMVTGGITSINDYLSAYDANTKNLKDVLDYVGITREEIAKATYTEIEVGSRLSWGFVPHFSYDQGERQYNITSVDGQRSTTIYSRPLSLWGDYYVRGWTGYSQKMGWFGIMRACGNLVTNTAPTVPPAKTIIPAPEPTVTPEPTPIVTPEKCAVNPALLASDENCKSCPGNETIWASDSSCKPDIVNSKMAINTSQGYVDASTVIAQPGDRISYTLTVKNDGLDSDTITLKDNLADVLEYSSLVDNGGGTLDNSTNTLSWPEITLKPGSAQTRTFTVKILDVIPATAQGQSDNTSYDCLVSNTFGNATSFKVNCPVEKTVENVATELPTTGPTGNIIFACIALALAVYFYSRTRQLEKEVRIIRNNTNTGTILLS